MADAIPEMRSPAVAAFNDLSTLLPRVFKEAWLPLVVVHLFRSGTGELFTYMASVIQARGREEIALLASAIALQFLVEMAWTALWAFVVIDAVRRVHGAPSRSGLDQLRRLNRLLIEGVRAISAILFRVPLLLIPGLIEFVRLIFVPHVVLLDHDYEAGRVDALARSRELTRGRWWLLIFSAILLVGFNTYIEILAQGSTDAWMWERPGGFAITAVITLFSGLAYEVFLVALFLKLSMMLALRKD